MDNESIEYRLLRNQMVIMSALRNIVSNDNIKGLLDDNIEPTADMLQCNELSNYNHYQQGRADGYSRAENDYYKKTEDDRANAYDCGYENGRADLLMPYDVESIDDLILDVKKKARAEVLSELLSNNWWNTQQRMVMEEWIKNINSN